MGLVAGARARLRRDEPRLVGGGRGACPDHARRSSSRGRPRPSSCWRWRAPGARPALELPPVDTRRHARALPGAALRARADGYPRTATSALPDAEGGRRYRAYFTADFVWHMALTAEMTRFEMPPRNPYMADRALHYYWTYFLVPAALTRDRARRRARRRRSRSRSTRSPQRPCCSHRSTASPRPRPGAERRRRSASRSWCSRRAPRASRSIGDLCAARRDRCSPLRDINIDAVTAWWYDGLRIDGVHRTMFYTPQHGLSCALGLLAVTVAAAAAGAAAPLSSVVLAGLLLGAATLLNPFLGSGVLRHLWPLRHRRCPRAAAAACASSCHTRSRRCRRSAPRRGACSTAMSEGAGQALTVGWAGHARHAPARTLMLSLGPVLVPAAAGLLPIRGLAGQAARTAGVGLLVGLFLFYFVMLSDQFWVGFRAGQILLAMTTVPLARRVRSTARQRGTLRWPAGARDSVILVVGAADDRHGRLQRLRHRQCGPGRGLPLDREPDARPTGGATLGAAGPRPHWPSSRPSRSSAGAISGA